MKLAYLILAGKKTPLKSRHPFTDYLFQFRKEHSNRSIETLRESSGEAAWHSLFDSWAETGIEDILVIAEKSVSKKALKEGIPERVRCEKERHPNFDFHYLGNMF